MSESSKIEQAVGLLQELGLKEYEAKCFVALSRLPQGTAKDVSDISDVPRTRVYDATRVLETKGLVEVQHSNPQQFRAVDVGEAIATLDREYESRMHELRSALQNIERVTQSTEGESGQEVWSLSGETAITNRLCQLVAAASEEVLLVIGGCHRLSEQLATELAEAAKKGVRVTIGTLDEGHRSDLEEEVPGANVFESNLDWLVEGESSDEPLLTRMALVDRTQILVGSGPNAGDGTPAEEHATLSAGSHNGIVLMTRRLLRSGFSEIEPSS